MFILTVTNNQVYPISRSGMTFQSGQTREVTVDNMASVREIKACVYFTVLMREVNEDGSVVNSQNNPEMTEIRTRAETDAEQARVAAADTPPGTGPNPNPGGINEAAHRDLTTENAGVRADTDLLGGDPKTGDSLRTGLPAEIGSARAGDEDHVGLMSDDDIDLNPADDEDEEDANPTLDELNSMSVALLRQTAVTYGVTVGEKDSKAQLVATLHEFFESDDEDEEDEAD